MTGRRRQRDELQTPPPPEPTNELTANTINPIASSMIRRKNKRAALLVAVSALVIVAAGLFASAGGGKDSSSIRRGLKANVPAAARVTGYDARRKAAVMGRPRRPGRQRRQKAAAADQDEDTRREAHSLGHKSKAWTLDEADELIEFQCDHLCDTWQRIKSTADPQRVSNFVRLVGRQGGQGRMETHVKARVCCTSASSPDPIGWMWFVDG